MCVGSQCWPGSIPRVARPAVPGSPPPPSRSPGGAQGGCGQGLWGGGGRVCGLGTNEHKPGSRVGVLRTFMATTPHLHGNALPLRSAHREGNAGTRTLLQAPARCFGDGTLNMCSDCRDLVTTLFPRPVCPRLLHTSSLTGEARGPACLASSRAMPVPPGHRPHPQQQAHGHPSPAELTVEVDMPRIFAE